MNRTVWISLFLTILSRPALAYTGDKLDDLCQGDPALAVMTSDILAARKALNAGKGIQSVLEGSLSTSMREGRLQCIIGAKAISPDLLSECEKVGVEVIETHESEGLHQIVVRCSDPRQLDSLAHRPEVRVIASEPRPFLSVGAVENQADTAIHAVQGRAELGVDGSGVRVGVLSDTVHRVLGGTLAGGFLTQSSPQITGDLPLSIRVIDPGPASGTDEGAGMMELIYDLAPGCNLSFASAVSSYAAFAQNITALATDPGMPCDVIVDDVGYLEEPMYQDGPIAVAAANAVAGGASYFSSAANLASQSHERAYSDTFPGIDETTKSPTGADLHDFGVAKGLASDTYLQVSMAPGAVLYAVLHWDEPYGGGLAAGPGSEADLDLYLTNTESPPSFLNMLAFSNTLQGTVGAPAGDAYESFAYQNSSGGTVYISIDHYAGRESVNLNLLVEVTSGSVPDSSLLGDRTVYGHSCATGAAAVAAMFYGEIEQGGSLVAPSTQLDVESFSSKGGNLPVHFPPGGSPRFSTPDLRAQPLITAPDGTNTTNFGTDIGYDADTRPNFFGTSASAPHAAAVAALVLSSNPALSPQEILDILTSTATDAETPGMDGLSGYGLIDALRALRATRRSSVDDWLNYR